MVFTGTYHRSLDEKLRVMLPKRLRTGLPEGTRLFLTPGQDHCLELHTDGSLAELAEKASASTAGSKSIRSFARLFYARAVECDVDKQGRVRIPTALAELADIEKEVVFVGVGFHWELWNENLWNAYLTENQGAFEEVTQMMMDGFHLDGPVGNSNSDKTRGETKVVPK